MSLYLPSPDKRALVILSSATSQALITFSCLSSSVIKPRLNIFVILSTSLSASSNKPVFSSGISISETETVKAPLVENLKPRFLILSSIFAVSVAGCLFIQRLIIFPRAFLSQRKSISKLNLFSGFVLSTKPIS